MSRALNEKRRYRAVRNATYDTKLAKQARGWSDDNIFERLGVRVPKTVPVKRPLPKIGTVERERRVRAAKRRLQKYSYAVGSGVSYEEAYRLRYRNWEYVETVSATTMDRERVPVDKPTRKVDRKDRWTEWSQKHNDYPEWVKRLAARTNRQAGFDDNASYGWAMVYYSFIDNEPLDATKAKYQVDPFDGDNYLPLVLN